jgi:t-SNARE complex subunit (syntaxin)
MENHTLGTEYWDKVIRSLVRLETLAETTEQHLRTLNGTVKDHGIMLGGLEIELKQHQLDCPLRNEVEALKTANEALKSAHNERAAWINKIFPFITAIIGGVIVIFLLHSNDILKWIIT